jgi:hypothetical protein
VSRFDCDESDEDITVTQVRDGVLNPGLQALEQRFGPSGPSSPSMAAMEATPGTAGAS